MPCYDHRDDIDTDHNSRPAMMLCSVCQHLIANIREQQPENIRRVLDGIHVGLFAWWEEHRARDERRTADNAVRSGLMTPDELIKPMSDSLNDIFDNWKRG